MRQSLTVVLERNAHLSGEFGTEPYEAAWAGEARWFVRVLELTGSGAYIEARTQISPDGLHWCDLDDRVMRASAPGLVTWSANEFGGWLRLKGVVAGDAGATERTVAKVLVYLALKA